MTSKRKPPSLDSFPQEFFSIWDLALEDKLDLKMESKGQGTSMKQRLYTFRKLLVQQGIENSYYQVDLKVVELEGEFYLISHTPEWKKQVRSATVNKEAMTVAKEILGTEPKTLKEAEAGKDISDSVSAALKNLGFSTGD
jgi:hypothetical protein